MSSSSTIVVCTDAAGAHWQLGYLPPAHGRMVLLGWRMAGATVDSGVPQAVQAVLARAFAAVANVTFPASGMNVATAHLHSKVRSLSKSRLFGPFDTAPRVIDVISTRDPVTIKWIFDDPAYPWSLQGQVALLSAVTEPIPQLTRKSLLALMRNDFDCVEDQTPMHGLKGIVRPGVDGDIVGLLMLDDPFAHCLLAALEYEAGQEGLTLEVLSQVMFEDMLSATEPETRAAMSTR